MFIVLMSGGRTTALSRLPGPGLASVLVLALLLLAGLATAAAPAGSWIRNQASATWTDDNGTLRQTRSNLVETRVQQVAGMELHDDQHKVSLPGLQVTFSHRLTNTGNGVDAYGMSLEDSGSDDFDFISMAIYRDANQDGVADDDQTISATPNLSPGESFSFVIVAAVPSQVATSRQASLVLTALSEFDGALQRQNTDSVLILSDAVLEVTKSLSQTRGDSPDGPLTVTLAYRNLGEGGLTGVWLLDGLPDGMIYVPGSARWTEHSEVVLTDADADDAHLLGGTRAKYCAYDASCFGLPQAGQNQTDDSTAQVSFYMDQVGAGQTGSLSFQVMIASGLQSGSSTADLQNTADYRYLDSSSNLVSSTTNQVVYTIEPAQGVVANGSRELSHNGTDEPVTAATIAQGTAAWFDNIIWNTGNVVDVFDIEIDQAGSSFPSGTLFQLFAADGRTPLQDSDGNGIVDTGPVSPSAYVRVVLKVNPPSNLVGDNDGQGFSVSKRAISQQAPEVSDTVVDHLPLIVPAGVDLTNNAALGQQDVLGEGLGPEEAPVQTLAAAPGESVEFKLFVNNTGQAADQYQIGFTGLPESWQVTCFDASDQDRQTPLTQSASVEPGESQALVCRVLAASDAPVGQYSVIFEVTSAATGAVDKKHDAVGIPGSLSWQLEPDHIGQSEPGGAVTYPHQLINTGTETLDPLTLTTSADDYAGWQHALYVDTDADGVLGPADQPYGSALALLPGESVTLFVQVFAPPGFDQQHTYRVKVIATDSSGEQQQVNDVTQLTSGQMTIVKEQALDIGCDGSLDSPFSATGMSVEPGQCVRYRLTATNAGDETVFNARIADATPPFTVYTEQASCTGSGCSIASPAVGATGLVLMDVDSVSAGDTVQLQFSVQLID